MKTRILLFQVITFSAVVALTIAGCRNPMGKQPITESPTRGNKKIGVDESFKLLFDTQSYTFSALYPDAKITPVYKPEIDVLNDLMKDSVEVAVLTRDLNKEEREILLSQKYIAVTTKIAKDAIALIVHPDNNNAYISTDQIKKLFLGEIKTWKDIDPKKSATAINVVFDNKKSGNVRYFLEKFNLPPKFPENFAALNSNEEVVKYVSANKGAMGILSVNWISDKHDSISNKFLESIRVMSVSDGFSDYCKPYQGYIADSSYPLIRSVYMINRESFAGLGTGFVSFVSGDQGQRIVLKSGLVPATMPIRLIHIKKD